MGRYLIKRLIRGILSIIATVLIVMVIVYSLIDRSTIVNASDATYAHLKNNLQTVYKYQKWEDYGYIDYVNYEEYLTELKYNGTLTDEEKSEAALGQDTKSAELDETTFIATKDSELCREYVTKFVTYYQSKGYTIERFLRKNERGKNSMAQGGTPQLIAYKDVPLITRAWKYFTSIIEVDNIHNASGIADEDRKIEFTWYDPVYGGEKFSPAIMGYGTTHRYLLYFTNEFPFIHQNLISINLGVSTDLSNGEDVWHYMTKKQGRVISDEIVYFPSGVSENAADDLHTLVYSEGSYNDTNILSYRFVDDYTVSDAKLEGKSAMGYSFVIGIISTAISYLLGIPLGILMSRNKDKLVDKLGTLYVIFIIAVPSLAYIYMFRAIGGSIGLPTTFFTDEVNLETYGWTVYVLPIVSLALPSVAGFMKWIRRYMIDQQNSDYVKFARSEGLSESEIFNKHISKNALIPIIHGIPGSILGALTGAVITESIYSCPGVGRVLTQSINATDNAVIVGVTLFYAVLSVVSIILGDILMALVDPRINFSKGGR